MLLRIRRISALTFDIIVYLVAAQWMYNIVHSFFLGVLWDVISQIVVMFMFYYFMTRKDSTCKHGSFGKKIMFLRIYDEEGNLINCRDNKRIIRRNIINFRWFYLYPFMILYNVTSYGDKVCKTVVK